MSSVSTQRMGKTKEKGAKTQPVTQTKSSPEGTKIADSVNPKIQPTAEQMRIAQIVNEVNKLDPDLKEKVEQVMELTGKSNDEAIVALHDCDDDFAKAVVMLLDGKQNEGEWELSGKKKKNRQTSTVKTAETNGTDVSPSNKENRVQGERSRNRDTKLREGSRNRGGPPRLNRGGSGRKWRNKESEKNERNLEDRQSSEGRHRGGRRGRGRGNRSRTFQNRVNDSFPQSIDTWTNSTAEQADANNTPMTVGNWSDFPSTEDWSEEDWTESLTETKVFTPSALSELPNNTAPEIGQRLDLATLLQQANVRSDIPSTNLSGESVMSENPSQVDHNQYSFSQYAKQAAETIKAAVGVGSVMNGSSVSHSATSVSANYQSPFSAASPLPNGQTPLNRSVEQSNNNSVHVTNSSQPLPPRSRTQKARIPPPSKIPESAVEMPDDAIQSLDVQFGALEFGADPVSFDFNTAETPSAYPESHSNQSTNSNQNTQTSTSVTLNKDTNYTMPSHSTDVTGNNTSHSSAEKDHSTSLTDVSKVTGSDSVLLTSQKDRREISGISAYGNLAGQTTTLDGTLENNSSDNPTVNSYSGHRNSATSYQSQYTGQKSSVLNSSNLTPSSNSYSNSPLSSLNNQQQNSYVSVPQSQNFAVSTSYVMGQSAYSGSTQSSGNSTYHGSQTAYNSHSVSGYGVSNFANQQGYNSSAAASSQQPLHSSSISSKLGSSLSHGVRDVQHNTAQHNYELSNVTTSALNVPALTSAVVSSCAGLIATSALGLNSSSSTTTTSVLKNSLPASVPAMLGHQYIMGQAGLPFYGYYDMQFQASTSMTGRDPNVGNVAYTGMTAKFADVKYSRGETEVAAVSTALSQGQSTQPHGQPFINPAPLPPGYGYYFPGGMMAGGIHHYAPPIFPLNSVSPATNAHGASPNAQFQKPTGYGSHSYSSVGYESLTQAQDFAKGTYGSGSQSQGKGVSAGSPDISAAVYNKNHAQLAKSYEKPGFHAGTPPPFNLAGSQTTGPLGVSSAPYAATPFIPVLAHGQHHSTLLHHHLQQDPGHPPTGPQRNTLSQQKGPGGNKQNFAYWSSN
ncbi:protein lingerer-like isoform X3 [Centruroides sculpturatus]|uniref:protein lingerer-like isoform X3 n=1 Tax=Centruroides sculpturatus TaxID=218467 RepID=UPI000C6CCC46|nr:protein lingerer-like isoform X3 [Centruroides sculpturatus]